MKTFDDLNRLVEKDYVRPQPGHKVRIHHAGKWHEGVVFAEGEHRHRKAERILAQHGIHQREASPTVSVSVPGYGVIRSGQFENMKITGKATPKEVEAARAHLSGLKQEREQGKFEGRQAARSAGFHDAKPGEKIHVEFRGGVKHEVDFLGVSPSGRVKFRHLDGREMYAHPQFASRIAKTVEKGKDMFPSTDDRKAGARRALASFMEGEAQVAEHLGDKGERKHERHRVKQEWRKIKRDKKNGAGSKDIWQNHLGRMQRMAESIGDPGKALRRARHLESEGLGQAAKFFYVQAERLNGKPLKMKSLDEDQLEKAGMTPDRAFSLSLHARDLSSAVYSPDQKGGNTHANALIAHKKALAAWQQVNDNPPKGGFIGAAAHRQTAKRAIEEHKLAITQHGWHKVGKDLGEFNEWVRKGKQK